MIRSLRVSAFLAAVLCGPPSQAVEKDWIGNAGVPDWGAFLNWSPFGAPNAADEVTISNGDATRLDQDFTIASLDVVFNGSEVDTNGHTLTVDGQIDLGTTEKVVVSEHSVGSNVAGLNVERVQLLGSTANGQSDLHLDGGRVVVSRPGSDNGVIFGRGMVSGHGVVRFEDALTSSTTQFRPNFLDTARPSGVLGTQRVTLRVESVSPALSEVSLSGFTPSAGAPTEQGVTLGELTTFDVDTAFRANIFTTMTMEAASILDTIDSPSTASTKELVIRDTGTLQVNANPSDVRIARTATLRGSLLRINAEGNVNINAGTLIAESGLAAAATSTVTLNAGAGLTVGGSVASVIDGDLIIGSASSLSVNGNLTINENAFDWDGADNATTNVNSGGVLTINADDIESGAEVFDGVINVTGGVLNANITGGWTMAGDLNLSSGAANNSPAGPNSLLISGGVTANGAGNELGGAIVFTSTSSITLPAFADRVDLTGGSVIQEGAKFLGQGLVQVAAGGATTLANDLVINLPFANGGNVFVAAGAGVASLLTYDQLSTGELVLEIGGVDSSQYDQLSIANAANLAGELDINLINGFNPSEGDAFTVLSAGILGGQFSTLDLPTLSAGLAWDVDYGVSTVTLSVVDASGLDGDYNNDGMVTALDYSVWRAGASPAGGTQAEYDAWAANFGAASPVVFAAVVPEPAALVMLVTAVLPCGRRRSRRE